MRISPFDNQGRRQTSFAAVEVIPLIEQTDTIEIPDNEIHVDVFRSCGPGGQSVNTTDSAVRHDPPPHRHRGVDAEREVADPEPRGRPAGAAVPPAAAEEGSRRTPQKKAIAGDVKASWGDQMRSYVLHPYQMVKDLRTEHEVGNPQAVFDGEIDDFIDAGIRWKRSAERDEA